MTRQPERKEITISEVNRYFITASWGPRAETPEELATRFFRMIDNLKQIDPVFQLWVYGRRNDLGTHRDDFVKFIGKTIERDDWGVITPNAGYWFGARSPDAQPPERSFSILCHAGSSVDLPSENNLVFKESTLAQPTSEMHSHRIFHAALRAIVDAWAPDTVEANCGWLVQRKKYDSLFRPAWMRYLCPALARQVKPPASALVENLANGGLLLSATDETFDIDNPAHVAAAEEIAAALNRLDRSRKSSQP
jgi:Immunity protein 52